MSSALWWVCQILGRPKTETHRWDDFIPPTADAGGKARELISICIQGLMSNHYVPQQVNFKSW